MSNATATNTMPAPSIPASPLSTAAAIPPNNHRTSVFVTTENVGVGRLPMSGKWFELKEYADHSAFMAAANQYATEQHPDNEYTLQFMVFNKATFALGNLISPHHISEQVWDMLDLHWCVVDIFHAYVTLFGMCEGNVKHSLNLMSNNYEGYFANDSSYLKVHEKAVMKGVVRANGYYFTEH